METRIQKPSFLKRILFGKNDGIMPLPNIPGIISKTDHQSIGNTEGSAVIGCNVHGSNNVYITLVLQSGCDLVKLAKILSDFSDRRISH